MSFPDVNPIAAAHAAPTSANVGEPAELDSVKMLPFGSGGVALVAGATVAAAMPSSSAATRPT